MKPFRSKFAFGKFSSFNHALGSFLSPRQQDQLIAAQASPSAKSVFLPVIRRCIHLQQDRTHLRLGFEDIEQIYKSASAAAVRPFRASRRRGSMFAKYPLGKRSGTPSWQREQSRFQHQVPATAVPEPLWRAFQQPDLRRSIEPFFHIYDFIKLAISDSCWYILLAEQRRSAIADLAVAEVAHLGPSGGRWSDTPPPTRMYIRRATATSAEASSLAPTRITCKEEIVEKMMEDDFKEYTLWSRRCHGLCHLWAAMEALWILRRDLEHQGVEKNLLAEAETLAAHPEKHRRWTRHEGNVFSATVF